MTENECLQRMVAPGTRRPGKWRDGVIQILITSKCDKSCFSCTQASNVQGQGRTDMSVEQFAQAVESLRGYFGVVGVFGGNPAIHKDFVEICRMLRESWVPFEQRGLRCNNPINLEKTVAMRETFNPHVSNLNVHLDAEAFGKFKSWWPEAMPFGLDRDSRHSPPWIAMKDVLRKECPDCCNGQVDPAEGSGLTVEEAKKAYDEAEPVPISEERIQEIVEYATQPCKRCGGTGRVYDESLAWDLISKCDINQHWSAGIGVFRGELRAYFCEVAMAQSMLHQWETKHRPERDDCPASGRWLRKFDYQKEGVCDCFTYPDTGLDPTRQYDFEHDPRPIAEQMMDDPGEAVIDCDFRHVPWWRLSMPSFREQVRQHCHSCGVPMRGYGQLAQAEGNVEDCLGCDGEGSRMFQLAKTESQRLGGKRVNYERVVPGMGWHYTDAEGREIGFKTIGGYCTVCNGTGKRVTGETEQVSETHADVYKPKNARRPLQLVTEYEQVQAQRLELATAYLQNSTR